MPQIPEVDREIFPNSSLKYVICQVRYADLHEMTDEVVTQFQNRIQNSYPIRNNHQQLQINVTNGVVAQSPLVAFSFHNPETQYTITLNANALSVETSRYVEFRIFRTELDRAIRTLGEVFQVARLNRVGLRYVNEVFQPLNQNRRAEWRGWLNPVIAPDMVLANLDPEVQSFGQQTMFSRENGTLAHRVGISRSLQENRAGETLAIDIDYYSETETELGRASELVAAYNAWTYRVFRWSISTSFLNYLRG